MDIAPGRGSISVMEIEFKTGPDDETDYLVGQLLIAMPGLEDERFARTVIYICSHSDEGAMGIVVNRPADYLSFQELLTQLNIIPDSERIYLPEHLPKIDVMIGGPVEAGRGFVLHSPDYAVSESTVSIDETVCLTATVDILRAIARGRGPRNALLALGYAGWAPGQLESEIQANSWLNCGAAADIIFRTSVNIRYNVAMQRIGVDLGQLSAVSGRA